MRYSVIALPVLVALSGCQAIEQISEVATNARCKQVVPQVDEFFASNPGIPANFKAAIMESRVENGMSKDMVAVSWGSRADKIELTGVTRWVWENRQPKGEWVDFRKDAVVNASFYKPMFLSNYKSCKE